MTPENRDNQPAPTQPQTQPQPAQVSNSHLFAHPQPAFQPEIAANFNSKKPKNPALVWGGLALGLVVLAVVAVLVIIPLFNRNPRTEADPFAVARNVPAGITAAPVSGAVVTTTPSSVALGPVSSTVPVGESEAAVISRGDVGKVVGKGEFTKIDAIHYARGTATVGIGADGKKVLRFENFTSAQGPDLKVYLGTRPDGSLLEDGGLNLGALPATDGSYNIALPDDLDLSKYRSVVIWCEAFSVTFSVASLA